MTFIMYVRTWSVCPLTDAQRVRVIGPEQQSFGGGRQNALGATLIINDLDFSEGILFAFSTYVEERTNFRFQMWRPIDNETSLEYQLISERAATPTVIGREDVSTLQLQPSSSEKT